MRINTGKLKSSQSASIPEWSLAFDQTRMSFEEFSRFLKGSSLNWKYFIASKQIVIMFLCCDCNVTNSEPSQKLKKIGSFVYKPNDKIGQGNYSTVYMGIDEQTGNAVAVKVVRANTMKSQTLYNMLQSEIQLLKNLHHPNILECISSMNSPNNCYIITEYCENGDLERYLKVHGVLEEAHASRIAYGIFKGLQYLAQKQIVHRDLKVANIFLQEDTAKIGDFGFAMQTGAKVKDISVGSPAYMSPEALLRCEYGPKTDIWSFGVLVYEMLHGQTPSANISTEEELKQQISKPPKFKATISQEAKNFILLCMEPNQKLRISIKQIRETPFMKKAINGFESGGNLRKSMINVGEGIDRHKLKVANAFYKIRTEEAVSIIHYCRLIHKTTSEVPSIALSQWLITISDALIKAKIQPKTEKTSKVIGIATKYHQKYLKEHNFIRLDKTVENAISEIQQILRSPYEKECAQELLRESELMKKSFDHMSLATFTKYSNSEQFLKNQEGKLDSSNTDDSVKFKKSAAAF